MYFMVELAEVEVRVETVLAPRVPLVEGSTEVLPVIVPAPLLPFAWALRVVGQVVGPWHPA